MCADRWSEELDRAVFAFEAAWNAADPPTPAEFFPEPDAPGFRKTALEVLRVDVEKRVRAGLGVSLDEYQYQYPGVVDDRARQVLEFERFRAAATDDRELSPGGKPSTTQIVTGAYDLAGPTVAFQSLVNRSPGSRTGADVSALLHRRLRLVSLGFLLFFAYCSVLVMSSAGPKVGLFLKHSVLVGANWLLLAVCGVAVFILWLRPSLSLRSLRRLELVMFGLALIDMSSGFATDLFIDRELLEPLAEGDHSLFHYASSWALPFFALIVAYGVLVPSGWKRCSLTVAAMGLPPLAIAVAGAAFEDGLTPSFGLSFLFQFALWMTLAGSIAVFGAHRIESLRSDIAAARRFGPYRIERKLSQGGMGEVYLARHELMMRACAIKVIRPERRDARMDRLFEREVRTLAALRHPNTVQVFDYGCDETGTYYYVMEYLDGPTLRDLVAAEGPLESDRAVMILSQLCGAVAELHDFGLIHRDIKPENVIVVDVGGSRDIVKLLDFGLTQGTGGRSAGIAGTPAYMSPEQCQNAELDCRSDIYSLGAVAYFLLAGTPPYSDRSVVATLSAHIEAEINPAPLPDDVPDWLDAAIFRSLQVDRSERFQSVEDLRGALDPVAPG